MKLAVFPAEGTRRGNRLKVTRRATTVSRGPSSTPTSRSRAGSRHARAPGRCDGSFVVNEPLGAQSWFPSNNYMSDKARYRTAITVPASHTALGVGELVSTRAAGNGRRTWIWEEDDPTATYLTSATVGRFEFATGAAVLAGGRSIPVYVAIDSAGSAAQRIAVERAGRSDSRDHELPQRHLRPVPLRLDRAGRRLGAERRLRAGEPDEAPLRRRPGRAGGRQQHARP